MREILFRGKLIDTGKWIYGNYEIHKDYGQPTFMAYIFFCCDSSSAEHIRKQVEKNTVCEWTGLKDRNGILVFENDVIKYEMNGKTIYGLVEFHRSAFSVEWFDEIYGRDFLGYLAGIEVIGNIHDNPELLPKH